MRDEKVDSEEQKIIQLANDLCCAHYGTSYDCADCAYCDIEEDDEPITLKKLICEEKDWAVELYEKGYRKGE